jgi:hypothetical protein
MSVLTKGGRGRGAGSVEAEAREAVRGERIRKREMKEKRHRRWEKTK